MFEPITCVNVPYSCSDRRLVPIADAAVRSEPPVYRESYGMRLSYPVAAQRQALARRELEVEAPHLGVLTARAGQLSIELRVRRRVDVGLRLSLVLVAEEVVDPIFHDRAAERRADLLVLGTAALSGRPGLRVETVVGSNLRNVPPGVFVPDFVMAFT
jgi:nucleotide-binding universal stress UspA family protein